jgi:hypothetical protein
MVSLAQDCVKMENVLTMPKTCCVLKLCFIVLDIIVTEIEILEQEKCVNSFIS